MVTAQAAKTLADRSSATELAYYFEFGLQACTENLLTSGWSRPENGFVWSEGLRSSVLLPITCPKEFRLTLRLGSFVPPGRHCGFYLVVNSIHLGLFHCGPELKIIDLQVERQPLASSNGVILDFFHVSAESPAKYGGKECRSINIALESIRIESPELTLITFFPEELSLSKFTPCESRRTQSVYTRELEERNRINSDTSSYALTRGIQFFMYGYGGNNHDRKSLLLKIWERSGSAAEDKLLLAEWRLNSSFMKRFCPQFSEFLVHDGEMSHVEEIPVYPEIENPLYDPEFSNPWRNNIPPVFDSRTLPAESILKCKSADLLISRRQHLIFDSVTMAAYAGCNPAGLSKLSIPPEVYQTDRPVVLLQDQFDCTNIAHFFYDSCLRAFHYCTTQPQARQEALFVLGGEPTEFHRLVLNSIAELFGLSEDQFLFPRDTVRLQSTNGIYWFSDQVVCAHPAQRCRPEAVAALQRIAGKVLASLPDPNGMPSKIYISRSDAGLRRLHNEGEVFQYLSTVGFQRIVMSTISWADQIAILASADTIVAPHGMGLTLLAFNLRRPRVVELFNPLLGSEAYALLSKAYGNDYTRLIGEEVDPHKRDFVVNMDELRGAVA